MTTPRDAVPVHPHLLLTALLALAALMAGCSARPSVSAPAARALRQRLLTAPGRPALLVDRERIHAARAVPDFYRQRGHRPGWLDPAGCPTPLADELAHFAGEVGGHGLRPGDYHWQAIQGGIKQARLRGCAEGRWPAREAAGLELLLSDAFIMLASHLVGGRIDPESLDPQWQASRREVDPQALLTAALASGKVSAALTALAPRSPGYLALIRALARHRGLARRAAPGEAARQVRVIEANLERWRWLPDDLGRRHVEVRVAAFELALVERGRDVLTMRAVVGKRHRRTPMLSSALRTVVLNPSWQVPHKIAVKDIIPQVRKDPGYLQKQGITLYAGWAPGAPAVDPASVDWKGATLQNFRLRLRQRPGASNALGRFKFLFPNKYDVYLHDTPKPQLFGYPQRTFSSGCVRLQRPLDLADALLRGHQGWTRERIQRALGGGELALALPSPVPVHLTYFTAWADADGAAHFRPDVYGRDRRLLAALDRPAGAVAR